MKIRDITSTELALFGDIISRLQRASRLDEIRSAILPDLTRLLRADTGSSCKWDAKRKRFEGAHYLGVRAETPVLYNDWFQFHDPITFKMRDMKRATIVDEIIDRHDLDASDFYQDLLRMDRHRYGINIFSFDDDGNDLGDFRFWRRENRENFEEREKIILDVLAPFFSRALRTDDDFTAVLTAREKEVVQLLARGCTDRDIARVLGISFGTVRTHVNRALEKMNCSNRAELAATVAATNS